MILEKTFVELRKKDELGFIVYLSAGFPTMDGFLQALKQTAENGADIIEVGLPFSDPIADGPTIQDSSYIGLQNGASLETILPAIKSLELTVPLVLMSYLNPLLAYGDSLCDDLKDAGFRGMIIPDLPLEEADGWIKTTSESEIDLILLVSPSSSPERIANIAKKSQGFIYCVSTTGTTGVRRDLDESLGDLLSTIRQSTDKPIAVGFGISTPEHIRALHGKCDGVIMGSRIIKALKEGENVPELIRSMKDATKI